MVDAGRSHTVRAGVLDVAVERSGVRGGWPVVLLHGFPYDARSYDDVAAILAEAGADVVVPYLRGVSALWPDRVAGLVTQAGYNVQDIRAEASTPKPPATERALWYQ
jgi:pimeloyl-ACP methyl ester carboxylesterase